MQGMFLAVRSGVDEIHEPKIFMTAGAESFVREVLGQEPRNLVLRLESWSVSNMVDQGTHPIRLRATARQADHAVTVVITKDKPKLPAAISSCRQLIQDGLSMYCTYRVSLTDQDSTLQTTYWTPVRRGRRQSR